MRKALAIVALGFALAACNDAVVPVPPEPTPTRPSPTRPVPTPTTSTEPSEPTTTETYGPS